MINLILQSITKPEGQKSNISSYSRANLKKRTQLAESSYKNKPQWSILEFVFGVQKT